MFDKIKSKIKKWVLDVDRVKSALILLMALCMSALGLNNVIDSQEYKVKITQLTELVQIRDAKIVDLEITNAKFTKLIKFYKDQVIDKSKKVKDITSYISKNYRTICPDTAARIAEQIVVSGEEHGVPVTAIVGVMEVESHFDSRAISKAGARGLMQVMPLWVKELGFKDKYAFHGVKIGVDAGVRILKRYLTQKNNNMEKALHKYEGGSAIYVPMVYKSMAKFIIHSTTIDIMEKEAKQKAKGEVSNDSSAKGTYGSVSDTKTGEDTSKD